MKKRNTYALSQNNLNVLNECAKKSCKNRDDIIEHIIDYMHEHMYAIDDKNIARTTFNLSHEHKQKLQFMKRVNHITFDDMIDMFINANIVKQLNLFDNICLIKFNTLMKCVMRDAK